MTQKQDHIAARRLTSALFIIYLILLCWILLLKLGVDFSYMAERRTNFNPFREQVLNSENILNLLIFIPPGIYTAMLFESWSFGKRILFIFSLSFLVELIQYTFRLGAFDITDLITNTLGGIIGLIVFKIIKSVFTNPLKAQRFINIVASIATVLIITLLVLLKLNMLPIRYQ